MNKKHRLALVSVSFAVCIGSFTCDYGRGFAGELRPHAKNVVFESGFAPGKMVGFGPGTYRTYYSSRVDDKGERHNSCQLMFVEFLRKKYKFGFSGAYGLKTGDVIGMLGGVFRARCTETDATLDRIPDKELPKGVKLPHWDSITVPLGAGGVGFHSTHVRVRAIRLGPDAKDTTALLLVAWLYFDERPNGRVEHTATVKAGDIVLIRDKGHEVRAIVPANGATGVVGWVELSPEPIPEADLIRDKKAFVRPVPEKKVEKSGK
jgi:hypothetical protein